MEQNLQIIEPQFTIPNKATVKDRLDAIAEFQELVRLSLKEGKDYGTIPGTKEPTLYKPGAEKIVKLLQLADTYEVIHEVRDWDRPLFSFTVRTSLLYNGEIVAQGLGECNTMEEKYRFRWVWPEEVAEYTDEPIESLRKRVWTANGRTHTKYRTYDADRIYSIVNTILKMAKKRSLVDAALSVGRLSDLFTQDLEDLQQERQSDDAPVVESKKPYKPPEPAEPFNSNDPYFANKGEFMRIVKKELDMNQQDVFTAFSFTRMADLDGDNLVGAWDKLKALSLIPAKEVVT